jgi:hypothetical protein
MTSRIGLCVGLKNFFSHVNGVTTFGDLNFFLVILSEAIVKCVISFDSFVKILEDKWKS